MKPAPAFLRHAVVVGALTLVSRITGMAQSMMLAAFMGNGAAADAFFVAMRLPNLLRRLTAEGTMTAAFLPTLSEVSAREGEEAGKDLTARFLGTLGSMLAALCVLGVAAMGLVAGLLVMGRLAPGQPVWIQARALFSILAGNAPVPGDLALTVLLGRIMFPYVVLVSLTAGLAAVLNLKDRFGLTASISTFWNLAFMAFAALCFALGPKDWRGETDRAAVVFAVAVMVGGVVQLAVLLPSFLRLGYRILPGLHLRHPGVRLALRRMGPGLLGSGVHPLNAMLSTFLASRLAEGSQAVLFNTTMLGEMVLGLFAVSVATVSLPAMSRLADQGDREGVAQALGAAWRGSAFLALPAALGMALLAQPIVALIFQKGRFTAADVHWTAWTLGFQMVGIPFVAASRIGAQALNALKDYRGPAQAAVMSVAANLILSWWLLRHWGTGGIALANGLSALLGLLWLGFRLRPRLPLPLRSTLTACGQFLLASLPMALAARWSAQALGLLGPYQGSFPTLLRLLPPMALAAAVYFAALLALGNEEARGLWRRVWGR